jgi:hypothetical protein
MIYIYQSGDAFSVSADKYAPAMFKSVAPRVYSNATDAFKIETHGRIRDALKLFGVDETNPVSHHFTVLKGAKAANNASCRSPLRHGCVKASIHPLDRAPLSAAKQARRTERLATRRVELRSDECCEHCGYPASAGHPSDCAHWMRS